MNFMELKTTKVLDKGFYYVELYLYHNKMIHVRI